MKLYSIAFLMASAAMTMAACIATPASPTGSTGGLSGGGTTTGGTPVVPPSTPAGEDYFVKNVYPQFNMSCSACHTTGSLGAPRFMSGATPHDTYLNVRNYRSGALIQVPSLNLLLNKGKHEGPDLTGQQYGIVENWLKIENPTKDTGAPQAFFDVLLNFASCMDFTQFKNNGLDKIAALPVRAGNATCATCHTNPQVTGGVLLDDKNAQATFDGLKVFPGVLKLVSAEISPTGAFQDLQPSNRLRDKGTEFQNCSAQVAINLKFNVNDPTYCHPDYDFPKDFQDNVRNFVNFTLGESQKGLCQNQK